MGDNGTDPLVSCGLDWNSWGGCPTGYAYDESVHPTAWTAAQAIAFLDAHRERTRAAAAAAVAAGACAPPAQPFFLKASFHRPHSPYDPPLRVLNSVPASALPPLRVSGNWDRRFTDNEWGCGPEDPDAWCGSMPAARLEVSKRSYYASIQFVDEQIGEIIKNVRAQRGFLRCAEGRNALRGWMRREGRGGKRWCGVICRVIAHLNLRCPCSAADAPATAGRPQQHVGDPLLRPRRRPGACERTLRLPPLPPFPAPFRVRVMINSCKLPSDTLGLNRRGRAL
jgi:hypothetical protein